MSKKDLSDFDILKKRAKDLGLTALQIKDCLSLLSIAKQMGIVFGIKKGKLVMRYKETVNGPPLVKKPSAKTMAVLTGNPKYMVEAIFDELFNKKT